MDFNVISVYTAEQAIDDGVLVRLAENIVCMSNLAYTLAPSDDSKGFDLGKLWTSLLPSILAYGAGVYFDKDATDYPEEADAALASYLIQGHKVWIMTSYPGSTEITIMLPEDY